MKNSKAMYALTYGLFVLTARQGDKDNGCIINTACQVTESPNRITIAVNKSNLTHDMVLATGQFTLSILSQEAPFSLFQRFGFQSGRDVDKFDGYQEHAVRGDNGILRVTQGACAWLSCKVVSTLDLGTHTLFLADVEDGDLLNSVPSVTYTYYQANIKPKPQAAPAAPTAKKRWVCVVCGYVYEGDFLPEDFICPWCKHPASDFEPLA
ncbi:flavin reductase [Flavonifractor sp. An100]|uniref:flavin reductase family protein n=1 Tax=Flavonifractor sp. An100 TaxID=1965538 RepID=UPI000B385091|nr:flavin reductase [Flavonifractor sp. An100]OUQ77731.1 flavin reductase [Flavonifractor sp. An100]